MGRTAAPAIPGTDPAADTSVDPGTDAGDAPTPDAAVSTDPEEAVVQEGLKAELAAKENADLKARIEANEREMAEMRAMMQALGRNQIAQSAPTKVELPTMAETMKKGPTVPVLTEEGWYVPPVHPTDRAAKD